MKHLFCLLIIILIAGCDQSQENEAVAKRHLDYVKSAHYFSSAWPKTFWQEFEEPDVAGELGVIKADGFNTIVLAVPWRGFEVGFDGSKTQSNDVLYQRLDFLLKEIIKQDLSYMLRVGFPHDYTQNTGTDGMQQCVGIYTDEKMQNHWRNYLTKINQATKPYQHASAGTMVSWEDFWCPHFVFPNQSEEQRLTHAQAMGYGDWLRTQNNNIVKVLLQNNDIDFNQVKVPQPGDLSYVLYLEFIDVMLDEKVLKPTQQIFSDAALEIRVDKLPVKQGDQYTWIGHNLYLSEKNHRGTYWAPFWGAANNGELLTAEQALHNFKYFLKVVSENGQNTNHVIEQFNFYDNTPYFPNNANILPDEIDDFLMGAAPLLEEYSKGFGVWAYRDYIDNGIHNGSFEMDTEGWEISGQTTIISTNGDESLQMAKGATINQSFQAGKRFMLISQYDELNLCVTATQAGELSISVGDEAAQNWTLQAGENCTTINAQPFNQIEPTSFGLTAISANQIDEIKLFGFTQKLGLYDAQGKPAENLAAYRKLNELVD